MLKTAEEIVRHCEGCELAAYADSAGVWTIGYGHTLGVSEEDRITPDCAEEFLRQDLESAARIVDQSVKVPLTANQREALISFVFNVGPGRPKVKDGFLWLKRLSNGEPQPGTMLRKLNDKDYAGAAAELKKWTRAGGRVLPGLVKRRALEAELFLS